MKLIPHPHAPARAIAQIDVAIAQRDGLIEFRVHDPARALLLPPRADPARVDGLWRTTCFEAFVGDEGGAYREYNFSPSSAWAAYRFTAYRAGMAALPVDPPPEITAMVDGDTFRMVVRVAPGVLGGGHRMGLSAVIEEVDGTKSYWALAHPPGAPDFHHRDCFVLDLAAGG